MLKNNGTPLRLVDEFFYKPVFLVDSNDYQGYEIFRLQHKNALKGKLNRAFRKMVYLVMRHEFEENDNIEMVETLSIQST